MAELLEIEKTMIVNALCLLEEMQNSGLTSTFYDWFDEEQFLIEQTIMELSSVVDDSNVK